MSQLAPTELSLRITPQPDEETCGPTSLHAVYRYHEDDIPLEQVVRETTYLPSGGTLAVYLGLHAIRRGYDATIYTCNVKLFDPTWFRVPGEVDIRAKLRQQYEVKGGGKLRRATEAYGEYLSAGGRLFMRDITLDLLAEQVAAGRPIVAGLNATWLYQCVREREDDWADDDVAGEPLGHFVVIHGVDPVARTVRVADPYKQVPYPAAHHYTLPAERVIGAIMLGIVTYDAKLLVIEPPER